MILYHYTALNRLPLIEATGLWKGDVSLTREGVQWPVLWLTSDPDPAGHGLGTPGLMTDAERYSVLRWRGDLPPPGAAWDDKREVKIRVKLPSGHRLLKRWKQWAPKRLETSWLKELNDGGGGTKKSDTWYLYRGIIPYSDLTITV